MITILCSPKPFANEAAWNQLNALRSWRAIDQDIEIIIYGATEGVAKAAEEVQAVYVPEIEFSLTGAPSFNGIVGHASKYGKYPLQMYINCDILINFSMIKAMRACENRFGRFLLVGERLDLKQGIRIDTQDARWVEELPILAENRQIRPHGPTGVDYFGFIRGLWEDLPPVFMGRAMCDNALLHYCLSKHIPVVDGTCVVAAVHQFHDYQHVRGGVNEVFGGEDRAGMMKLHGLNHSLPTIADSGWAIVGRGDIKPKQQHFLRRIELIFRYRISWQWIAFVFRALQYVFDKKSFLPAKNDIRMILDSWQLFTDGSLWNSKDVP